MIRTAIGLADDDDDLPREPIERLLERMYEGDRPGRGELFRRYQLLLGMRAARWLGAPENPLRAEILVDRAMARVAMRVPEVAPEAIFALLRRAVWIEIRAHVQGLRIPRSVRPDAGLYRYALALALLPKGERKAFTLRFDFEFSYTDIAVALDLPSASAARARVTRAVLHLADTMDRPRSAPPAR